MVFNPYASPTDPSRKGSERKLVIAFQLNSSLRMPVLARRVFWDGGLSPVERDALR
jgi:hypothetical protein